MLGLLLVLLAAVLLLPLADPEVSVPEGFVDSCAAMIATVIMSSYTWN